MVSEALLVHSCRNSSDLLALLRCIVERILQTRNCYFADMLLLCMWSVGIQESCHCWDFGPMTESGVASGPHKGLCPFLIRQSINHTSYSTIPFIRCYKWFCISCCCFFGCGILSSSVVFSRKNRVQRGDCRLTESVSSNVGEISVAISMNVEKKQRDNRYYTR